MKKLILIAIVTLTMSVAATAVSAQRATRVHFKRGSHSTVITGYLSGYKSERNFVIRVRAGQTMSVEALSPTAVSTFLSGPPGSNYEQDMAADCHGQADVDRTDAGDYKLQVVECQKADPWKGKFRVRITVR